MNYTEGEKREAERNNVANHQSNERTLLAWVRTSIAIMAFGFVVVRFALFVQELNLALGIEKKEEGIEYSGPIGIAIVATGAFCLLVALLRYRRTKKEINTGSFRQSAVLLNIIIVMIFVISILLLVYLVRTL
jgi:putative membrane protein